MKLYLLKRKSLCRYDEADSFVVRAKNSAQARKLASKGAGDEGKQTWLNKNGSSCRSLKTEGTLEIVIRSFNAG